MPLKYVFMIILILMLLSCTQKTTDVDGFSSISGTIYYCSAPIGEASVRLSNDQKYDMTISTDADGYFEFLSVPNGEYDIHYSKTFENGGFVERNSEISVEQDINLESLLLPEAVTVYEPINITFESMEIRWSPTNAADFREYKIYRATSSGLDENTGLLVHVSTSINDTIFVNDELDALEIYFYRIYVMNEFGRLGGSNIVSETTLNLNCVVNGGFEFLNQNNNFPQNWQVWNNAPMFFLDDETYLEGQYSINIDYSQCNSQHTPVRQYIDPSSFIQGARYKLSFWVKIDYLLDNCELLVYFNDGEDFYYYQACVMGPINDGDWTNYSYEFTIPENSNSSNYELGFYGEMSMNQTAYINAWLDEVSIYKIN